jgi:hypothetical protein
VRTDLEEFKKNIVFFLIDTLKLYNVEKKVGVTTISLISKAIDMHNVAKITLEELNGYFTSIYAKKIVTQNTSHDPCLDNFKNPKKIKPNE